MSKRARLTKGNRFAMAAGGLIFLCFGLPVLYLMFLGPFLSYVRSLSWRETPCTILESRVYSTGGSSSGRQSQPTHRPQYTYSYRVEGREYRSDRYTFFLLTIDGYDKAASEAAEHPVGSRAICYVDPSDPREAVFNRDFRAIQLVGLLFPGVFMGMGLFSLGLAVRGHRQRDGSAMSSTLSPPAEPDRAAATLGTGAVTLKPHQTAFGALMGGLAGATVWNGLLGLLAYFALRDTFDEHGGSILRVVREVGPQVIGSPDMWLALLCPSPFILVGVLLIVSIPFQILALFNPRPRLTLSAASIPAGGSAQLHWRLSGGGAGIQRLTIVLEARQLGTIRKPAAPHVQDEGSVRVAVPADAPTSSIDRANPLQVALWHIRLTGHIPFWPDVERMYPVVITAPPR